MLKPFRSLAKYSSSSKGAKIILIAWIAVVVILSVLFPSADDYSVTSTEGSVGGNTASDIAEEVLEEEFPDDDGLTALLVFHDEDNISKENREKISELSEWFESDEKPAHIASALPYHKFPEDVQDQMYSDDETTLIFNLALADGIESDEARSEEHTSELQSRFDLVC